MDWEDKNWLCKKLILLPPGTIIFLLVSFPFKLKGELTRLSFLIKIGGLFDNQFGVWGGGGIGLADWSLFLLEFLDLLLLIVYKNGL